MCPTQLLSQQPRHPRCGRRVVPLLGLFCALSLVTASSGAAAQSLAADRAAVDSSSPTNRPSSAAASSAAPAGAALSASPPISPVNADPLDRAVPAAGLTGLQIERATLPDPPTPAQATPSAASRRQPGNPDPRKFEEWRLRRERANLLAAGSGLFAAAYLPAVLLAALGVSCELAIPVAGPVATVVRYPPDNRDLFSSIQYLLSAALVVDTIAQAAGVIVFAVGIGYTIRHAQFVRTARLTPSPSGLVLTGTF